MAEREPAVIQRWSTRGVPVERRLDHYAEILSTAVEPMRVVSPNVGSFAAEIASTELGPISVVRGVGTSHRCVRDGGDIARNRARDFHLVINVAAAWRVGHRGEVDLRPGDAIVLDSQREHDLRFAAFDNVHLKMPQAWLLQWLAAPDVLVGRAIPFDAPWGRALTAFATRLSPEFAARAPLPGGVISDQVGALLALAANEVSGLATGPTVRDAALSDRIRECIVQRCTEHSLAAGDVASALAISLRTLHRALAACRTTFGGCLMQARVELAVRLLQSPLMDRVRLAEIGRRAGFADPSHFARALRLRTGLTPSQLRRTRGR